MACQNESPYSPGTKRGAHITRTDTNGTARRSGARASGPFLPLSRSCSSLGLILTVLLRPLALVHCEKWAHTLQSDLANATWIKSLAIITLVRREGLTL